jgi:hypothetical protein
MKKGLLLIVTILLMNKMFGQTITLNQKMSGGDIKIVSGDAELYFKTADILDGIASIDNTLGTNNSQIADAVKANQLQNVDLGMPMAETNDFIKLVKTNLGIYLIAKGKVAVSKGGAAIASLAQEHGQDQLNLDGSKLVTIQFFDQGSKAKVFSGSMNSKLL